MSRQWWIVGILAVLVVAGIAYWALRPDTTVPETEAPPITGPERAEDARGVIAELERAGTVDYDAAFDRAQEFQRNGQLPDAQLLYFFAARGDHGPSAFELAEMNDPNHHDPQSSLLAKPDPFQAYRWYTVARDQGVAAAAERLEELQDWARMAAEAGDAEAERLLLQWE